MRVILVFSLLQAPLESLTKKVDYLIFFHESSFFRDKSCFYCMDLEWGMLESKYSRAQTQI